VQKGLIEEKITVGHARAILMIPDEEKQIRFYEHVVDEGLTVRKTEIRARNIQRSMNAINPMASRTPRRTEFAGQYEPALQSFYGYNAKVRFNAPRNRFEVRFYAHSEKECEELVNMLLRRKEIPKNVDADVLED
jgi:ParB family chromosome partitioning protein